MPRARLVWFRLKPWVAWMADREIWPLSMGVALTIFATGWAPWGLSLCAILWLIRWLGHGRVTVRTSLEWPVCLLLLMIPVTMYVTTDRQVTFLCVSRLLACLALVYGLANWTQRGSHVALLVLGLIGAGLGLALLALISVRWFSETKLFLMLGRVYDILPQLVSDTIHPNMMAGALAILLPFPLAMMFLSSPDALPSTSGRLPAFMVRIVDANWPRRLLCIAAALSMAGVLVLTKSRGGYLAGAVVLLVVLARRWRFLLWLIPIVLLGAGVLARRGDLIGWLDTTDATDALYGWDGRVEVWSRALYMIQDFPITGIGAGTFRPIANALYPFLLAGPNAEASHAHSLLLQVAVDLGIPGLVAFLSVLVLTLWSAFDSARFYRRSGNQAFAAVAWAGLASMVGMLVHGMVDATSWIISRGSFAPWVVIGTVVALNGRPALDEVKVPERAAQVLKRLTPRPIVVGLLVLATVGMIGGAAAMALRETRWVASSKVNALLLHCPDAQNVERQIENPPADSDWVSALEITTFSTLQPITGVVDFCTNVLEENGWETEVETGDATSWGGIYTQDDGHKICLLNAFEMEDQVRVSIVCGNKEQPMDLPPFIQD